MRPLLSALLLFALNVHATEAPEQTIGAAEALLRYIAQQPPLINATSSVCIKIDGQEAPLDLKARLKNTNLRIVPCGSDGFATQIPISDPKLESDGNYRLFFGYFPDAREVVVGKTMWAFMRLDERGWHVLRVQGSVVF
jgi:hypothetical protein